MVTTTHGEKGVAKFLSELIVEELLDGRYVRFVKSFWYQSDYLGCLVEIPPEFICDFESVPLFKSPSKRAGSLHDYFCRSDSVPVVTKWQAAMVYLEAQKLRDDLVCKYFIHKVWRNFLSRFKTAVVICAPGYFHKHKVLSTLEEISA